MNAHSLSRKEIKPAIEVEVQQQQQESPQRMYSNFMLSDSKRGVKIFTKEKDQLENSLKVIPANPRCSPTRVVPRRVKTQSADPKSEISPEGKQIIKKIANRMTESIRNSTNETQEVTRLHQNPDEVFKEGLKKGLGIGIITKMLHEREKSAKKYYLYNWKHKSSKPKKIPTVSLKKEKIQEMLRLKEICLKGFSNIFRFKARKVCASFQHWKYANLFMKYKATQTQYVKQTMLSNYSSLQTRLHEEGELSVARTKKTYSNRVCEEFSLIGSEEGASVNEEIRSTGSVSIISTNEENLLDETTEAYITDKNARLSAIESQPTKMPRKEKLPHTGGITEESEVNVMVVDYLREGQINVQLFEKNMQNTLSGKKTRVRLSKDNSP